jgi:hypothetical protein
MKLPALIAIACSSLAVCAAADADTAFKAGPRDTVPVSVAAPAMDLLASLSPAPEVAAQNATKRTTSRSCSATRRAGPRETIIACR